MKSLAERTLEIGILDQGYRRVRIAVDVIARRRDPPDGVGLLRRLAFFLSARRNLGGFLLFDVVLNPELDLFREKIPFAQLLHDFFFDLLNEPLLIRSGNSRVLLPPRRWRSQGNR